MLIRPPAALHDQLNRLFDLALIGIALQNHRDWNAVSAEYKLSPLGIRKPAQCFVYFFHQRLQIKFVIIEGSNAMHRNVILEPVAPLVEAAARSSAGIVGIHRKQDNLMALRSSQLL